MNHHVCPKSIKIQRLKSHVVSPNHVLNTREEKCNEIVNTNSFLLSYIR
jgi:hypothetical protein